jgi:hypothetical protein
MSDVKEDGYKVGCFAFRFHRLNLRIYYLFIYFSPPQASEVLAALAAVFGKYSKEEREAQTKKVLLSHSTLLRIVPSS